MKLITMKNGILFVLSFMTVAIFSCKKDDKPATKTELISSAVWKYDTAAIDANNDGVVDTAIPAGMLDACDKDNTLTFVSDGSGTADEGAEKCDPASPQTSPFKWVFAENETKINFTGEAIAGLDGEVKVLELTNTSMKISQVIELTPGFNLNMIVTLKH